MKSEKQTELFQMLEGIKEMQLDDSQMEQFISALSLLIRCIKSDSQTDIAIFKIAESLISSNFTDAQKNLRIYDIYETLMQELNGALETLERLNDDYKIDGKTMSGDMNAQQSQKYTTVMSYIKNCRKLINPIGQYLYDYFSNENLSEIYQDQIDQHYAHQNPWDSDVRSNIIRRLCGTCRGFKFLRKK